MKKKLLRPSSEFGCTAFVDQLKDMASTSSLLCFEIIPEGMI
jgi:hypothetical protein